MRVCGCINVVCMCARVYAGVRARVCVCVCVCALALCVCVRVRMWGTRVIWDVALCWASCGCDLLTKLCT